MGLDSASYAELWRITSETGVLPEHILPTLYFESGFDPSIQNRSGADYFGLNQASTDLISAYAGTDPQTYLTWPASAQLRTVVRGYVKALVNQYGKIHSATRFEQANFYPASLETARGLNDAIVSAPSAAYNANAGLDKDKKGSITVSDLARVMTTAASSRAVQSAIAATYANKGRYAPLDIGVSGPACNLCARAVRHNLLGSDGLMHNHACPVLRNGFGLQPPIDPPMMEGDVELVTQRLPPIGLGASPEDINHIVYGDDFGFWQMHPNLAKLSIAASILTASWLAVKSGWIHRYL
jgi:hypothetical protein